MKEIISAQVILKWTQAPPDAAGILITSENIGLFRLDEQSAQKARNFFSVNNFEVGGLVANSFSITASKEHFQHIFGVQIHNNKKKGYLTSPGQSSLLPLSQLPDPVQHLLECITFVEPPQYYQNEYNV